VTLRGSRISPEETNSRDQMRKAAILTGAVGAIFAILFIASLWLLHSAPKASEADQNFVDFYSSDERRKIMLVGLYVLPLSAIAFIWFIASLRQWVSRSSRRGSQMIGTVQLLSGIGFITLALASAAAATMPAALVELGYDNVDADMARDFPLYGDALLLVFGVRMSAMFVMTTTSIGGVSGFMPRWFSVASIAVALVLFLSFSLTVWLAVLFPLWVLALGILIIYHAYRADPESLERVAVANSFQDEE
jgi:hypothetical protein